MFILGYISRTCVMCCFGRCSQPSKRDDDFDDDDDAAGGGDDDDFDLSSTLHPS